MAVTLQGRSGAAGCDDTVGASRYGPAASECGSVRFELPILRQLIREDETMLDLHFWPTPNGKKVTILLEELELKYNLVPCNIGRGDQFKPEFLKMNPNHRMPVLVDHEPKGGGAPITIFESGAIMMYLAEKEGRFWPQDVRGKYEVAQWLIWQMANQGPKLGECGHFRRAGPEAGDFTYAVRRFTDEANRLYGVMNNRLYNRRYLAGDEYTIADMISYPWTVGWQAQGQDIGEFKHFSRWFEEVGNRPAVKRGMETGNDLRVDPATLSTEERERMRKIMYNQRAIPAPA
jgi:GSH-dependent disulfide-bond oxidoreductase